MMENSDLDSKSSSPFEETKMSVWKKRETWDRKLDFLLACIGCSVGLGNVWRFPYLCYKNGGGAFLLPYLICALVGGIPIFFLELAVGQFMSQGGPRAWTIVPLFQGIGISATIVIFILNTYYNVILTWAFYYMFSSFTSELPWVSCDHDWNKPNCTIASSFPGKTNDTEGPLSNRTDPVTEFWEHKVLGISDGLEDTGNVKCDLALCLLLAWIIVYVCVCKGVKSTGKHNCIIRMFAFLSALSSVIGLKLVDLLEEWNDLPQGVIVVYFTATSPYIFMVILVIRNCTLDGASDGIGFYLRPNVTRLGEPTVWVDAATQIIYSWGIGMGTLTVLGSYNKFHHNSLRDSMIFSVVNIITSFLAGFIVFTILGFMAKQQNVLVSDVAESGPGLAFIAYPKAVAQLPISPLWSILFFAMLILLGLDTQFVGVEAVITAIVDQYPRVLRKGYRKEIFIGVMCTLMFLVGLPMVTEGGMYVFLILDHYTGSRIILLVALCEIIALSYLYGIQRFTQNIRMMIGTSWLNLTLPYFQISWTVTSPIFCLFMFAFSIYNYSYLTYERPNHPTYTYPDWAVAVGWTIAVSAIIWIPLVAIYRLVRLVWMGGRFSKGDFRLLLVPYSLSEHQRQPQDRHERCLADFEKGAKGYYDSVYSQDQNGITYIRTVV